jgi:hypothetical protein
MISCYSTNFEALFLDIWKDLLAAMTINEIKHFVLVLQMVKNAILC